MKARPGRHFETRGGSQESENETNLGLGSSSRSSHLLWGLEFIHKPNAMWLCDVMSDCAGVGLFSASRGIDQHSDLAWI